jgi:hypothetical protein
MPSDSIAFASIGLCHGVLVLRLARFSGLTSEPLVENTMERWEKIEEALAASAFDVEKLKRWQNIGGAAGNP